MSVYEILLRKNLPHVVTIKDTEGTPAEDLVLELTPSISELGQGLAELNKLGGISLLNIQVGVSKEGVTKIASVNDATIDGVPPDCGDLILPEKAYVQFKSDSWALGEFIVRHRTGKTIPRKFMRSQTLLDSFHGNDEILKRLLVLDPDQRAYTWEVFPVDSSSSETSGCSLM